MSCCNNIYPELDLKRWESCDSVELANADNYYTKSEIDEKLSGITTDGISEEKAQELIDDSLEDYYTKDEIDAAFDSVNNELANKLDASAYTPTDLSQYWTSAETAAVIEDNEYVISKAINELKDTKQDALVSGENIKTINGISLVGDGDIQIGTGGTTDLSNYYTKSETNDLLNDKLDASAYTPTDLSGYWTSGETQDAINAATSGIPSSQTIEGLRSDINALSGDVYTNYYTKSQVDDIFAEFQAQIDALHDCCSGSGDTDVKKYVLHSGGTEYSMDCNSSSTLSREDLVFNSGTSIRASAVTDVTIGDCVTNIGAMAMQYFSAMTSCTISSSVTTIEYSAFDGCNALTSLTIPNGVRNMPLYMCRNCWDLSTTNIPDGATAIREGAYLDCLSLMNITIPSTVTVIGNNAFRTSSWTSSNPTNYQKMQNIATGRTVTILAETPPTLGDGVFGIVTGGSDIATYPIYVPANSVNAYKAAWTQYANRIFAIP